MTDMYEVINQTEYLIELQPIEDIENCGDDFITQEEFEDMGLMYCYGHTKKLIASKVKSKLASYLADIPKGKKSIVITDDDLIEALKETETFVSDIIPNTRRVGNRLFKHTKAEKPPQSEVSYKNWTALVGLFRTFLYHNDVSVSINMTDTDRVNAIKYLKPLATFEQLKEVAEKGYEKFEEEDYGWMEKLYNDPTLAPLPKTRN